MRTSVTPTSLEVDPDALIVDPAEQTTYRFGKPDVDALANDIKENGQKEPVIAIRVNPDSNEDLKLAFGFGRYQAAKKLGIPLKVEAYDWTQKRQLYLRNLQESVDRMTHMDLAVSIRRMISEMGMTQQEIARWFGKSQSWVSQHVSMFKLDTESQKKVHSGELPWSLAIQLAAATPEEREGMLQEIENSKNVDYQRKGQASSKWIRGSNGAKRTAQEAVALFEKVLTGNYPNRLKRLADIMVDFFHSTVDDRVTIDKLEKLVMMKTSGRKVWRRKAIA